MMSPAERSYIFRVLGAGWLLAVFTGLYNVGFLALDDYNNEILGMIPAQTQLPIADWLNSERAPAVSSSPSFGSYTRLACYRHRSTRMATTLDLSPSCSR
jgi:hypothetical protein